MQTDPSKKLTKKSLCTEAPNFARPVWGELDMTCKDCKFNGQDIDTFPCAKCHTRH